MKETVFDSSDEFDVEPDFSTTYGILKYLIDSPDYSFFVIRSSHGAIVEEILFDTVNLSETTLTMKSESSITTFNLSDLYACSLKRFRNRPLVVAFYLDGIYTTSIIVAENTLSPRYFETELCDANPHYRCLHLATPWVPGELPPSLERDILRELDDYVSLGFIPDLRAVKGFNSTLLLHLIRYLVSPTYEPVAFVSRVLDLIDKANTANGTDPDFERVRSRIFETALYKNALSIIELLAVRGYAEGLSPSVVASKCLSEEALTIARDRGYATALTLPTSTASYRLTVHAANKDFERARSILEVYPVDVLVDDIPTFLHCIRELPASDVNALILRTSTAIRSLPANIRLEVFRAVVNDLEKLRFLTEHFDLDYSSYNLFTEDLANCPSDATLFSCIFVGGQDQRPFAICQYLYEHGYRFIEPEGKTQPLSWARDYHNWDVVTFIEQVYRP